MTSLAYNQRKKLTGLHDMNAEQIIAEVALLPIEQRAHIVESLLESLTPPDAENDQAWLEVARARLDDLRSGRVQPVSGEAVFDRIFSRHA